MAEEESEDRGGRWVGPRAYKLLWDGHSVVGVFLGLALFVIFYAGAFALFRAEIHAWADPALRAGPTSLSLDAAVAPLLAEHPPRPGTDVQVVGPLREREHISVRYQTGPEETGRQIHTTINRSTGAVVGSGELLRRSDLAEILYELHFFGQAGQAGEVVSGLVAVFLLFALVTGLLIHLRKLPRDWHTFRPKVKFRHALADAHTVLGLVGIPFTAVYAISGAFLSLLIVLLGPTVLVVFGGDQSRAEALLAGYEMPAHEPAGDTAPMLPFESYFDAAREAWDGHGEPYVVVVHGWGDRAAVAEVRGDTSTSLVGSPRAVFRATTGELLATSEPSWGTPLGATVTGLINLHYARLGPGTLLAKVLYFLLALAAGAVMLSGNVLWLAVRDKQRSSRTHRLLERLTLGVGGGLVVAVPTAFLVSRAITPESAQLVAAENAAFFGTWAAVGLLFALRGRPAAVLSWQLGIAALLSLLVPLANGVTTGAWLWRTAAQRDWNLAVVDAGFLTTALSLGLAAFALRRLGVMASIDRRPIAAPGIG